MQKIIVIGSKGMAGHVVKTYLEELGIYEVWGIARSADPHQHSINMDVSDTKKLEEALSEIRFDVVINCIGLLNKTAEDNPEQAVWFNSYFPHFLAALGRKNGFKLIHISTDCVFSGKEGGYVENSLKNGIGFYAQSKALGEVINDKDLTFRTSIIGPELKLDGIGLFHWFMNQTGPISGYKEAYWTGVTTLELAKAIHEAIQQKLTGLYHLVNGEKIAKYDLLGIFNQVFRGGNIHIEAKSDYKVDKSLFNSREDFKYTVPSYQTMIHEMKSWMAQHSSFYPHYNYL
ncbi:dTDP-4-dehydrorhamnose reductase family protein [Lunatimonas salinarum]|uniref:dTDP-4-dehydrorhamnose reductase family protein n=1 Tax=Lunatimonas salinarum TaxID=1774590 RepID=UPI001AE09F67|nr:SDR family oxidoreductase [Lunatimonas salinarum]